MNQMFSPKLLRFTLFQAISVHDCLSRSRYIQHSGHSEMFLTYSCGWFIWLPSVPH